MGCMFCSLRMILQSHGFSYIYFIYLYVYCLNGFLLSLLPNPHEETMFEWDIYNWWIFTLPILFWMYLLYDLYHYHIKFERGGGLNCASSLLIAYYKFIPHACLSLGKSLSFVLCFRTMHDLLFCLNFLLVFFFLGKRQSFY